MPLASSHKPALHYLLILIVLVGFGLRLLYIDQPMRYDESTSFLRYVEEGLGNVVSTYNAPNNHIFHNVLVWLIWKVFGSISPVIVRLPALFSGLLVIPTTYVVGKQFYGAEIGLIATVLAAGMPALILYSTNARGYSLVVLCALLMAYSALRIVRDDDRQWLFLFAGSAIVGFYSVPTMLYPAAGIALWILATILVVYPPAKWWSLLWSWTVIGLLVGAGGALLYVPVIIGGSGLYSVIGNKFVRSQPLDVFLVGASGHLSEAWDLLSLGLSTVGAAVFAVFFVAGLVFHRRVSGEPIPILPAFLIGAGACVFLQRNLAFPRVWIYLIPFFDLSAVAGFWWIFQQGPRHVGSALNQHTALVILTGGILLAFVLLNCQANPVLADAETGSFPDAEDLTRTLSKPGLQPGILIAPFLARETMEFYSREHGVTIPMLKGQPLDFTPTLVGRYQGYAVYVIAGNDKSLRESLREFTTANTQSVLETRFSVPMRVARYTQASLYVYAPLPSDQ